MELKNGAEVLVTGAGGFIGSHLTEELVKKGCRVRALVKYNSAGSWGHLEKLTADVKKNIEVMMGDIQDPFACEKAVKGKKHVFHLAALIGIPYSYVAPITYVDVNIKGTVHMMQAALKVGVDKFVHTSTSETYGTAQYVPIDEKHPMQGQSPYSASKIGADKLAESFGLSFELPLVTVRPFNSYGPRQSARAIVPTIISQIASGAEKIKLGSLDPVRDLTFVADTVNGFLAAAQSSSVNEVFNIGTGDGISIGDLAQKIMKLMNKKAAIQTDEARLRPENSEVLKLLCDNKKAKQVLNWEPRFTLEQGLLQTIDYIQSNLGQYKPEIYNI